MKPSFFICRTCGAVLALVSGAPAPLTCCGAPLEMLTPNATDAAREKHVPVITQEGNLVTVTVGAVEHPMTEAHSIEWIALETRAGMQRRTLTPAEAPRAVFALTAGDEVVNAYAYCNLHSLFSARPQD